MRKIKNLSPATIIETTRYPAKWDGCILTHSGGIFSLLKPRSGDVCLEDVAWGLAYKNRYGGHLGLLTVAEHSLMVADIIQILWPESGQELAGLLHDSCEAYTHDIQAPVRKFVKVSMPNGDLVTWGDMERRVNTAVAKALDIHKDFYNSNEVAAADILAAAIEKKLLAPKASRGFPNIPVELAHLEIHRFSPETAYELFLERYRELAAANLSEES